MEYILNCGRQVLTYGRNSIMKLVRFSLKLEFSSFLFATAQVAYIIAMAFSVFKSFILSLNILCSIYLFSLKHPSRIYYKLTK